MADDIHIIKPVEVLKNIAEPGREKIRQHKKNRQNQGKKKPAQLSSEHYIDEQNTENKNDQTAIDYCA